MSLKLGNTNIAGTQILYSTTGNNTDGAMTQAATTTELNNCVHKTGNETITGFKTFNGDNRIIALKNSAVTYNTAPSRSTFTDLSFRDKNGYEMGVLEHVRYANNDTVLRLVVKGIDDNWSNTIAVGKKADGTTYTSAPASDVNGSIVTTVNKSKTENGYFKLGNGLIIQWGRATSKTWNFPIPFSSNTSFSLVFNNNAGTDGYGRADTTASLTSTSVTAQGLCETPIRWLAIGY